MHSHVLRRTLIALVAAAGTLGATTSLWAAGADKPAAVLTPVPLATLERQARARVDVTARSPLTDSKADVFAGIESLEAVGSGRVPNYLRALALKPKTVKPFAHLISTFIYAGGLEPEVKLAMALRIAQVQSSPYAAVHLARLLGSTPRGAALLAAFKSDGFAKLAPADSLAIRYAELLTRDVLGVDDDTFRQVRGYYNDAGIIELTMTTSFFNYFTRLTEGLRLPVEPWVLDTSIKPRVPERQAAAAPARVALIGDEEIKATSARQPARPGALPIGTLANSQRAMLRVPELALAWREYGAWTGEASIKREIQLQVSFAVSMANGCRYCTLHQVLGLHGLGVQTGKLLAMAKSDEALTQQERAAVVFARALTRRASDTRDAEYAALQTEFGVQGALEVLMQTCTFSFMNRLTDGLRLPSEDEAIRVYREVYGRDFSRKKGS